MTPHIMVVDDELSMRELLEFMLKKEGYRITCAENGRQAISLIQNEQFDLLLCDIRLGDITGIEVLKAAKSRNPNVIVVMISAYATAETAVEAMNFGAYDYLPKPFNNDELKQTIAKALELKTLDQERKNLEDNLKKSMHFGLIVGNSPAMMHIYKMIIQIANTRTNILITGESGTGKELIAKAIHEQSDRREMPFIAVNCGGIPETLVESEFFGHKKGSFTGASTDKKGLFDAAHKGTIFLDEIGEINLHMQVKLLRVVQEKMFIPVGSNEYKTVDVRIIAATNKYLEKEVIEGRFREDLFYRLNVIEIKVPPLRQRKEDLRALAQHFLDKYSKISGKAISKISSYAIDLLNHYDFPGNIRELENLIERSVALTSTNILLPDSLALSVHKKQWKKESEDILDIEKVANGVSLDGILENVEKMYVLKALELAGDNRQRSADLLGINIRSLRYRMGKLGIEKL